MLVAFNAADYAATLEKKAPKAVKDEYMAILRTIFGSVPEPRSVSGVGVCVMWVGLLAGLCRQARMHCMHASAASGASAHLLSRLFFALFHSPNNKCRNTCVVQYVVTAWGLDQFSYGSYSYTKAPVKGEAGYKKAHTE